ncbi:hypothetical protein [Pseudonocardia sp. D17]|uniref:hypothetical protein n=1 Tax=Pseudonocardia sp. D17 TaxID=882661 RepID=UPI0030CF4B3B|nr:hypothetical protein PSD17_20190 [Pseudonocardia sp. D17]
MGAILPIEVPIGALVGAGGGGGHADASAWQRSSRKTSASTMQSIRDATVQSANAVRSQRSTVVQSVTQGERFEVSAESVANYNHCHALTIEYFEVLRHFRIDQRLVDVSECVFVPFAMSLFDSDKAIRWKEVLSRYLLDRRLRGGFAALERIAADYAGSDLPTGIFADEQLTHVDGELRLVLKLARPADDADGAYAADSWRWMRALLPWTDPAEFHARYLAGTDARDEAFARAVGQQVAEAIVDNVAVTAVLDNGEERDLKLDLSLVSDFRNGVPMTVTARMTGPLGALRRRDIAFVRVASTVTTLTFPDLSALFPETDFTTTVPTLATVLPSHSRLLVDAGFLSYRTAHRSDHLFRDQRIRNDLSGIDDVVVHTPLNTEELRNPRREDQELAARLLAHLNDNIEFYHKVIWTTMTPERRFLLLDRIKGPASVGGRSLASIVENRVLGVVGNCVVMPVAAGFLLDPALAKALVDPVTGEARTLLDLYQPEPVDPIRVSVPTKGVFAEAVMGRCNSCEKKEEDRFWRWEESPIPDSPTAILPVSTDSRRAEPPDLTPQQFPTPVVTVQNAPSLPDPAGLAGILALLGNADTFRDMAGLSETQRNSLAALQRAMGTAEYFGGQAAGLTNLAAQVYMAKEGIDKTLSKIQQAKDQQLIDPGTATALTKKALESALPATAAEPGVTATKEFGDIVRSAATSPDAEIAVTRPGGEAVSIRKRGATTAEDSGTGPSADGDRPAPRPDRPSDPPSRPGLFATPDERLTAPPLGMLVAYFSQWENDERVPPGARRLFSRGRVQSLGQQLRADHLDHHRSTAEPLDAAMVAELARRLAASTEPAAAAEFLALLLCHNHTRSQSRRLSSISYESMALPWDRTGGDDTAVTYRYRVFDDESNATFQDFEIALERGALPADIYEVGGAPSGFYLLYDPDELGHDDPADWYHYFLTRTVTHGIAAGVVERTGGIGPALDDWSAYSVGLYEIVTWVAGLLRDAQPDADVTDERFDAWLFANALSFLEEAYYGTSGEQGETVREGHAQHRGAREAVLALSDAGFAPVWRWFVPRAGTLQVYLGDLLDEASSAGPSAALRIGERLADLASSITPFVDQIWDFDGAVLVAADVPLGEHVPARAEADASGAATGVVAAGSPEFDALVRLDDPTVVVKDEEGSGADRMMTPRLAELVGALAAHVAQAFPGRRLRLTEAWDPDGEHSHSSLHYEGRAADLTVDDRDRAKLGRLAALAVQTGFDWVLHENDHVHVSVRAG